MKRRVFVLVPLALVVCGCAVGYPKAPSDIGDGGATLNGDVYSNSEGDVAYWFRYGETKAYDTETPHGTVAISDDQAHAVSAPISGLSPNTTYHWQLCVNDHDPDRDICNKDHTFATTGPATPTQPTYVTDTSVTFNGEVSSPAAGQAEWWFEYGQLGGASAGRAARQNGAAASDSPAVLESETPHRTIEVDDADPHPVSAPVTGLAPATTYGYRMCVDPPGDSGTTCSSENTVATDQAGGTSGIAFVTSRDENSEIYVMDPDGSNAINLTHDPREDLNPSWSPDATKLAFDTFRNDNGDNEEIYSMDADGSNQTNLTNGPDADANPAWSPDGTRIAFQRNAGSNAEIWVMDADGSDKTNLTNTPGDDFDPAWSPDGSKIAFTTERDGAQEVYWMNADGSNQTNLTNNPTADYAPSWSPDGTKITFTTFRGDAYEIYSMDTNGSNQTNLTNSGSGGQNVYPSWSPDGSKIAFQTYRGDNNEIFAMNADGSNQTNLTNNSFDDLEPDWSRRP